MKKIILTLLIILSVRIQAQIKNQNIWNKIPDDAKHVYAGLAINAATGSLVYRLTEGRIGWSLLAGFTAGVGAGFAKEYIWDKAMKKGTFNKMDIADTAWGSLIGTVCLRVGIDVHEKRQDKEWEKFEKNKEHFENLGYQ